MKVYFAAPYSRREEIAGYRNELQQRGHEVLSRWLGMKDYDFDRHGKTRREVAEHVTEEFLDVILSDIIIYFSGPVEAQRPDYGRREVALGIALGRGKTVFLVGQREGLFQWSPGIRAFDLWNDDLLDSIDAIERLAQP